MRRCPAWIPVTFAVLVWVGCSGEIMGGGTPDGPAAGPPSPVATPGTGPNTTGPGVPATNAACAPNAPLTDARLVLLTDQQYASAVRSLFGVRIGPEITRGRAAGSDESESADAASVSGGAAFAYQQVAAQVAREAVTKLDVLFGCPNPASQPCVETFLKTRVARAFRRPLFDSELQSLLALYRTAAADGPDVGATVLLQAVLQAPSFLYRTELGPESTAKTGALVTLTAHELASALSFALTGEAPDDELWASAMDGSIHRAEILRAQVARLLASPAARSHLVHAASEWLELPRLERAVKEPTRHGAFTPALKASLAASAEKLLADTLLSGRFADLLTTRRLHVDKLIAGTYGLPAPTGTTALAPIDLPAGRPGGILAHPAFLAALPNELEGSVVHRGLVVYDRLICAPPVPPPPDSVQAELAASMNQGQSEREQANLRASKPICSACHARFDPLGLAFSHHDAMGRHRTSVDGMPIDASVVLSGLGPDIDGPVNGLAALTDRLSRSGAVAACAARNLVHAAMASKLGEEQDCALRAAVDTFARTGSMTELFEALVTSPGFATRRIR